MGASVNLRERIYKGYLLALQLKLQSNLFCSLKMHGKNQHLRQRYLQQSLPKFDLAPYADGYEGGGGKGTAIWGIQQSTYLWGG